MMRTSLLVTGLAAFALCAGCGSSSGGSDAGSGSGSGHSGHSHPPTSVQQTTPPASPTPTPTPTDTSTAPVSATPCTSAQLALSLGSSQGAAGTTYQSVVFLNTGSQPCTLYGYPGISFINARGEILGKPASRQPGKEKTVTLSPGGSAHTVVGEPDTENFPPSRCKATTAERLQAYPPGQTTPLFVTDHEKVCTTHNGRTTVVPVLPGSG